MVTRLGMVCGVLSLFLVLGCGKKEDAEASKTSTNARVFFKSPADGAKVPKTFKVEFGLEGMEISKAGEDNDNKKKGHHHLIINEGHIPHGTPVPTTKQHLHYGKGQEEAELTLKPGRYTLTLQFADGAHRSYGEKMSSTINITVVDGEPPPPGDPLKTPAKTTESTGQTAPTTAPTKTPDVPKKTATAAPAK